MIARLYRLFKSVMNRILDKVEDPVLILENNIREMKEQVPKLNEGVAKAHGKVILLERSLDSHQKKEKTLRAKLQAAIETSEEEIGKSIALSLQQTLHKISDIEESMLSSKEALESMKKLRDSQVQRIKRETEKIKGLIEDSKTAKLKGELAHLFETYEANDVAFSNDEMVEKLEKEMAENEGKFASVKDSGQMKEIELEKRAEEIEAEQLFKKFKTEMNLDIIEPKEEKKSTSKKEKSKSKKKVKKSIGE